MEFFTKLYEAIINIFQSFVGEGNAIFDSVKEFFDSIFKAAE